MSAPVDAAPSDLSKVDSAVSGLSSSPTEEKKGHRRASSSAAGVYNINDLGEETRAPLQSREHYRCTDDFMTKTNQRLEKEGKELEIAKETQKLNWYAFSR